MSDIREYEDQSSSEDRFEQAWFRRKVRTVLEHCGVPMKYSEVERVEKVFSDVGLEVDWSKTEIEITSI